MSQPGMKRLNPHVSVDCVVLGCNMVTLKVLLIERKYSDPETRKVMRDLKLPGSLVYNDEFLLNAAQRVLRDLTGLDHIDLHQLAVFDSPHRVKDIDKQWLESDSGLSIDRVITVAYYALIDIRKPAIPEGFRGKAYWVDIEDAHPLAFDHHDIVTQTLREIRMHLDRDSLVYDLLPDQFTIRQLQNFYEIILGTKLDNRNFRKKIALLPYLIPLNEKQQNVAHKPAMLYRFDRHIYENVKRK